MSSAIGIETVGMTMRFGAFTALDGVSIKVRPGSFHALLGENGAGKSTLVKCMMGFYHATDGQLMVDNREVAVPDPNSAHAAGLGMVYQHFTLVSSLTAAENLVVSRQDKTHVIDWRAENAALAEFMQTMPFDVPLHQPVETLSAGEKQKLEIIKQLYLGRRFLILDEPTSVLTPQEANEVLSHVKRLCDEGRITVLMITHKFREVLAFANDVSVLRRGRYVGGGAVRDYTTDELASLMVGSLLSSKDNVTTRHASVGAPVLRIDGLKAFDKSGQKSIEVESLTIGSGEIVGIAGISGNGQLELMEVLTGQRPRISGDIKVKDRAYFASRSESQALKVRALPEEPLKNASVPRMSVAENMAFRDYDQCETSPCFWLNKSEMKKRAADLVKSFKVKTVSVDAPVETLSGGNVQRTVLARELTGDVDLLLVSNPCFGLDFSAVSEIRARIRKARDNKTAVLLISEDLDEILELSDRILVMSEGRIAFETLASNADISEIGSYMAGHA